MASIFIGQNRGQGSTRDDNFTQGTSTGSTDMEFRYDTGKKLSLKDVQLFLDNVERYLIRNIASQDLDRP